MAAEFNAVSSIHPREWAVLKNCWENLKKRAKQQQTLRNQHFLGTGGGPPKKIVEEPAIERVLELIQGRVSGYVNCFDSDGTQIIASIINQEESLGDMSSQTQHENEPVAGTSRNMDDIAVRGVIIQDWSHYTPCMLREARNPTLALSKSPSPEVPIPTNETVTLPNQPVTPPRVVTRAQKASTSRRRPMRRERDTQNLTLEKILSLRKVTTHAEEEHEIQMRILRLQDEREQELLKQEKIKTAQEQIKLEILEIELKKFKK